MSVRSRIVAEARSWLGTPYHHHGRVKGVGVDCAMLLAEVFERVGLVEHVDAGFYPTDWHLHQREELFLGWLARLNAQPTGQPLPGDVAVFRFGRTYSHGAIVATPELHMVHSYVDMGVIESRHSEDPLASRPCRFYMLPGV